MILLYIKDYTICNLETEQKLKIAIYDSDDAVEFLSNFVMVLLASFESLVSGNSKV